MKLAFKEKAIQVQKNIQYNQVCFLLHLHGCLKNEEGSTAAGYTHLIISLFIPATITSHQITTYVLLNC